MLVYETQNSKYTFDLDEMRYKREIILEQTIHSYRLDYNQWHPLKSVEEIESGAEKTLHIQHETSNVGIFTSPIVRKYEE